MDTAQQKRKKNPWFNQQCIQAKKDALTSLDRAVKQPTKSNLQNYNEARKQYKYMVKKTKEVFQEWEEQKMIENAEEKWYKALTPRQPHFPKDIPMNVWETHFKEVLQARETRPKTTRDVDSANINFEPPFTQAEIEEAIRSTKNNKACGPDGIYYEHLKSTAPHFKQLWTDLFNECLKQGTIPQIWRQATLKILYKGKGDTEDPNAYRGIALECTTFKILTNLLNNRLYKMTEKFIPEEQFGFVKGKSTLHAVKCLKEEIEDALRHPRGKLHAVFVDFTKAFDLINRSMIIDKLESYIGKNNITRIIKNILGNNVIQIDDSIDKSNPIEQKNGVLQGDPLSPLLFNIATSDFSKYVTADKVKAYVYADDMVLISSDITKLQEAFDQLDNWATINELQLNDKKTVTMTFRKGGRRAANDRIVYKNEPLTTVPHFKYLGITMQAHGNIFTKHVKERVTAATIAMTSIKNLPKLSLKTAMKLFELKITPIITYGIAIIWEHLTKGNLAAIERVKAKFLKRVLSVSKYTPSRLVYVLTRETFFIEDLRHQVLLPSTQALQNLIKELQNKREEIWPTFYSTDAMMNNEWTKAGYALRHLMTRFAVHGFHHRICNRDNYHEPDESCVCKLCERNGCDRYHVMTCKQRTVSLAKFCVSDN